MRGSEWEASRGDRDDVPVSALYFGRIHARGEEGGGGPENLMLQHIRGLRMSSPSEQGETADFETLVTVHIGRIIDGAQVGPPAPRSPGSKIPRLQDHPAPRSPCTWVMTSRAASK